MTQVDGLEGVVAAHGSKKNLLVIQLGEYEGHRLVNIRRWFALAGSGAWAPTKKGISLNREGFDFTLTAVRDNEKEIHAWLSGAGDEHDRVRSEREKQSKTAREAGFASRPYSVEFSEWPGPQFFRVEGAGGRDRLLVNSGHPVGRKLKEAGDLPPQVAVLLLGFGRACRLVDGGSDNSTSEAVELLTANWGFILQQYQAGATR